MPVFTASDDLQLSTARVSKARRMEIAMQKRRLGDELTVSALGRAGVLAPLTGRRSAAGAAGSGWVSETDMRTSPAAWTVSAGSCRAATSSPNRDAPLATR
jgi:hypothetical protein